MVKTNSTSKSVRSFRLSLEGIRQLKVLARDMGRSEGNVIEIALDRMYREEVRFGLRVGEGENAEVDYQAGNVNEEKLQ